MNDRTLLLMIPTVLVLSGLGLAQPTPQASKPVKPVAITTAIKSAANELLEQFQAFLRKEGSSDAIKCDAPSAWLYAGKIDDAAEWIGKEIKKRSFEISSEGPLKLSYGFTAQTLLLDHEDDLMLGGLIEQPKGVIAYLQRCHPGDE